MEDKRIPVYQNRGPKSQLQTQTTGLDIFKDCQFYCGKQEIDTCFNHLVGLPEKENGIKLPLFDYEAEIYQKLKTHKYLWILKATGLGISEFFLRYMLWLAVKDDTYSKSQFCIVVGPNINLGEKLIRRMRHIIGYKYIQNTTMTTIDVNNVHIQAYPSNHLDAYRSLDRPRFIFIDEGDFFQKGEQEDVRHVSERYIAKSDPYIVMVSTPNAPDGLFQRIEQEEPSIYHKLKYNYQVGLNKIFEPELIQQAKATPGFEREYNLKYLGKIGNVFTPYDIDKAVKLGEQLSVKALPINQYCLHICGVDPGFSSSKTAVYVGEYLKEEKCIRIIYGKEYDKDTPSKIADDIHQLHRTYLNFYCYVDGANRGFVNELKYRFGESTHWDKPENVFPQSNRILPVNFATNHKQMLEHLHNLMSKQKIAIPKEYELLIIALRTATAEEWSLKKDETVNSDSLDALRMLCIPIKFGVRQ